MTPIFASKRLDWSSAIGLFIINFGTLDYLLFVFLESQLPPERLARIKSLCFQDRIAIIKTLVNRSRSPTEQQRAFAKFFHRLDPVRELRNRIAHGHLLVRVAKDGKTPVMTLSLPKDMDAAYAPASRHLEFRELTCALAELTALIEEVKKLSGLWSDEKGKGNNP